MNYQSPMHGLTNALSVTFLLVIVSPLQAQTYNVDFSTGDSVDAIYHSKIGVHDLGLEDLYAIPQGQYEIRLDKSNRFIIPADRGQLRLEMKNEKEVRNLELITPILSIEETYALSESFHERLGLPINAFYEWAKPAEEHEFPRDFYGRTFTGNYPTIGISVHSSFNKNMPFFIQFQFSWDNWLHRRRGTSPESNTLKDFTFDVPKILASVNPEVVEAPAAESQEPTPEPEEVYEEWEPVEVIFDEVEESEPSEEPTDQSSQWWLWLIGVLVIVGGLGFTLRRKS